MLSVEQAIESAFEAYALGDFDRACWMARQALQVDPDQASLLNLLGSVYRCQGNLREALVHYLAATDVDPSYAQAWSNLGVTWQEAGQLDEAHKALRRAIEHDPTSAIAQFNWGNLLRSQLDLAGAQAAYERTIELDPRLAVAHTNLATILQQTEQSELAAVHFRKAVKLAPDSAGAQLNLGNWYQEVGNFQGAIGCYQKASALQPYDAEVHFNLGQLYQSVGDFKLAKVAYFLTLQLNSCHSRAHHNLSCILQEEGQIDLAIAHVQQALSFDPNFADAYRQLGKLWQHQDELNSAIACFERAIALADHPDTQVELALSLLISGQYTRGFEHYEQRWQSPQFLLKQLPRHRNLKRWTGKETLTQETLLVWAEGDDLGEVILFLRYLPLLAARKTVLECDRALVDFCTSIPNIQVIAKGDKIPTCDYQVPLVSLPYLLGLKDEIPPSIESLVHPNGTGVGLFWEDSDSLESLLRSIDHVDPKSIVILKSHLTEADKTILDMHAIRQVEMSAEFSQLVTTIASLARIVTIDSPIAHLAATLGKPTQVLEPRHWCWGKRDTTPWYPTVTIGSI